MNTKQTKSVRSVCGQGQTREPDQPSPARDAHNAPASVADSGSADPVILQQELAAQKDDCLRLAADFDNFKKRTRRDSGQQAAAQKEAFLGDLLSILDNLERALAAEQSTASPQLLQGVTMTLQQLSQLLQRHGIEAVEDVGQPFDPHRHEAVAVRQDPSQPDQIVLEVTQRGYCLGDKMFRPARVIVNDLNHSPGARHAG